MYSGPELRLPVTNILKQWPCRNRKKGGNTKIQNAQSTVGYLKNRLSPLPLRKNRQGYTRLPLTLLLSVVQREMCKSSNQKKCRLQCLPSKDLTLTPTEHDAHRPGPAPEMPHMKRNLPSPLVQLHLEELEEDEVSSVLLGLVRLRREVVLLRGVPEPRNPPPALRLILVAPLHQHRGKRFSLHLS